MSAPLALRLLLLGLLVLALLLPTLDVAAPGAGGPVWLEEGADSLAPLLLAPRPPPLLVRAAGAPPTDAELELLQALARRGPLLAARPEAAPALRVRSPTAPLREGRRGALGFEVRGAPGDSVRVALREGGLEVDSMRVVIPAGGEVRGAFRVRPARLGWHAWEVEAAGIVGRAGRWVADAEPPRVLLVSGPPTWESRFAARALEEGGATVAVSQSLGRGVRVGEAFPASVEALADYDVVLLMGGAPVDGARLRLLERYAAERGGGVLVAGAADALPALGLADGAAGERVGGGDIQWSLPAELSPLPAAPLESAAEAVEGARPGVVAAAHQAGGGALLALRPLGRGRAAALGLRETWRWRMQAGRVDEHREFWGALADWLAGGLRDSLVVHLPVTEGPPGVPVQVRVFGTTPAAPRLLLTRPGGQPEPLALAPAADDPVAAVATFVPTRAGVHSLSLQAEEGARAAFHAAAADPGRTDAGDRWARLALLAQGSGATALPADSLEGWVQRWAAGRRGGDVPARALRTALLLLIAGVAVAEWLLRRTRGLP